MCTYNFFVSGLKFTNFAFNSWVILLDNAVNRLSISQSVPKIFAVTIERCFMSRRILDVFCLPNFKAAVPPKSCTRVNTPKVKTLRQLAEEPRRSRAEKKEKTVVKHKAFRELQFRAV